MKPKFRFIIRACRKKRVLVGSGVPQFGGVLGLWLQGAHRRRLGQTGRMVEVVPESPLPLNYEMWLINTRRLKLYSLIKGYWALWGCFGAECQEF